jgi:hypothetical protein
VGAGRSGTAWASLLTGLASVATLPLAVYLTRFSDTFDLLQAGFAIPIVAALAIAALMLARRVRLHASLSLSAQTPGIATAGHVLGIVGLCMAAAALVALGVYGLLEYAGSRD